MYPQAQEQQEPNVFSMRQLPDTQVAIFIGRVGKTELAREYAYKYKHEFDAVFGVGAKRAESPRNASTTIALELHPEGAKVHGDPIHNLGLVHRWFRVTNRRWLPLEAAWATAEIQASTAANGSVDLAGHPFAAKLGTQTSAQTKTASSHTPPSAAPDAFEACPDVLWPGSSTSAWEEGTPTHGVAFGADAVSCVGHGSSANRVRDARRQTGAQWWFVRGALFDAQRPESSSPPVVSSVRCFPQALRGPGVNASFVWGS
ncbi:hypothetical protein B0T26DRAFT_756924 [Lasiosphaeria miniovina]|uniref:Uncharacterized protein n=1 Tax=Lasiosphaeria miniovina TaxID=1954250 RepID=A0AA39ZTJ4_9PEZI|nr:uncharacterized protein B0T26DRAFT_756924 [Lasiosphaeria miniovina]KAK0703361.1 hypothetical protein B0T26DRAFT_756924 [Lasiosphaeria miniovina]